jgi:hypothetical protein
MVHFTRCLFTERRGDLYACHLLSTRSYLARRSMPEYDQHHPFYLHHAIHHLFQWPRTLDERNRWIQKTQPRLDYILPLAESRHRRLLSITLSKVESHSISFFDLIFYFSRREPKRCLLWDGAWIGTAALCAGWILLGFCATWIKPRRREEMVYEWPQQAKMNPCATAVIPPPPLPPHHVPYHHY